MVYDDNQMYRVYILKPSIHEREILHMRGITTMCFTIIEMMYFTSKEDAHTYVANIKSLYPEFTIEYKVYRNIHE